jgi:hypothetical protein
MDVPASDKSGDKSIPLSCHPRSHFWGDSPPKLCNNQEKKGGRPIIKVRIGRKGPRIMSYTVLFIKPQQPDDRMKR